MKMAIEELSISYPNFVLGETISPDEFNINNAEFVNKVCELITLLNRLIGFAEDGNTGASLIPALPIDGLQGGTVQALIESLKSVHDLLITTALDKAIQVETDYTAIKTQLEEILQTAIEHTSNLNPTDIQTRKEIIDIRLQLDEQQVADLPNKTGIGFYDLFRNTDNINTSLTTAVVSEEDVIFSEQKVLKMLPQQFNDFSSMELVLFYKGEIKALRAEANVAENTQVRTLYNTVAGERFYYNGEVYTVTDVSEVSE